MVDVSEKALEEFKRVLDTDANRGLGIKVKAFMTQSSCCSCGPSQAYEMDLVKAGEAGDQTLDRDGVKFYFDEGTVKLMDGFTIDFMDEQGFIVKDNNAAPSCGCGGGGDYEGGHGGHGGGSCCG